MTTSAGSFNDLHDPFNPDYDFEHEPTQRTNFEYNLQFQGEFLEPAVLLGGRSAGEEPSVWDCGDAAAGV